MRSVLVLGAIVALLVVGGSALFGRDSDPVRTVDYRKTVEQVREGASYEVLAPPSLPDGWRATSTRYEPGSRGGWHLGVLTSRGEYIGLEQTPRRPAEVLEEISPDTRPAGRTRIDGDSWRVRTGTDGETTLVRRSGKVTVLVTGSAGRERIEAYASSLRGG